jgi:NAD(P)-dependent dehydrogenase (short-subunit alcohol dehydrogenase family)
MVRQGGGEAICLELDVTDSLSVTNCIREMASEAGVPDILVNNAGIARQAFLTDTSEEDWDAVIDTNLKGVFMMAQATAKAMINAEKPGSIINIASILGLRVSQALGSYIAAKSAVVQLTKAMALEWSRYNIRVNALAPGYFITEINEERFADGRGDEYMQQRVPMGRVGELPEISGPLLLLAGRGDEYMQQRVPMGRVGELPEISGPLLLLASGAGSYMTGSIVAVDGGHVCSSL